jgi:hypothetical protein
MQTVVARVLLAMMQHHGDHAREHQDVHNAEELAGRDRTCGERADQGSVRDEHRGSHLAHAQPPVTAVTHPQRHADGHVSGHQESSQSGVVQDIRMPDQGEDQRDGGAEHGHPEEHRHDHLDEVSDERTPRHLDV